METVVSVVDGLDAIHSLQILIVGYPSPSQAAYHGPAGRGGIDLVLGS